LRNYAYGVSMAKAVSGGYARFRFLAALFNFVEGFAVLGLKPVSEIRD
jgi:hypothetical protein